MSLKRVGAQVCGLFAEVEGEQFEHHLSEILPVYLNLVKDAAEQEVRLLLFNKHYQLELVTPIMTFILFSS